MIIKDCDLVQNTLNERSKDLLFFMLNVILLMYVHTSYVLL